MSTDQNDYHMSEELVDVPDDNLELSVADVAIAGEAPVDKDPQEGMDHDNTPQESDPEDAYRQATWRAMREEMAKRHHKEPAQPRYKACWGCGKDTHRDDECAFISHFLEHGGRYIGGRVIYKDIDLFKKDETVEEAWVRYENYNLDKGRMDENDMWLFNKRVSRTALEKARRFMDWYKNDMAATTTNLFRAGKKVIPMDYSVVVATDGDKSWISRPPRDEYTGRGRGGFRSKPYER